MSNREQNAEEFGAQAGEATTGEIPVVNQSAPQLHEDAAAATGLPRASRGEEPVSAGEQDTTTNDADALKGTALKDTALTDTTLEDTDTDPDPEQEATTQDSSAEEDPFAEFHPARKSGVVPLDEHGRPQDEFSASAGRARKWKNSRRQEMPRFIQVTLGLAATCVILFFVQGMQDIVAPVFLGLNLMIVVYPVQKFIQRWLPPFVGAFVSLLLVLLILFLFVWLIVWSLLELIDLMPAYNDQFMYVWRWVQDTAVALGLDFGEVTKSLKSIQPNDVMSLLGPLFSNLSAILSLLTTLVVATLFLAMDSASLHARQQLLRITKPRALIVTNDFALGVRRYWLVTTVFGLIVAIADVGALWLLGIPLIWVWGILSFITNYIPNVGFFIGLIPPALLAFLEKGWGSAIAVIVAYSVLNFVIQSIIQPKFAGESVGVTPTISFLSLVFWVWILGPLGALLALPATLLLKSFLIDSDPNGRWLNTFIAVPADSALPEDERPVPMSERKARAWRARKAILRG